MKASITHLLSVGVLVLSLTACGSGNNSALLASTASSIGSSSVAAGNIGFTINQPQMSATTLLAGQLPYGTVVAGNYGQISVGATSLGATSTGYGQIQYQQKPAGANGQFTLYGNQSQLYGNIQLSQSDQQIILSTYGQNATISSMGMWVVQNLIQSSYNTGYGYTNGYNQSTYSGPIVQVVVYFYINGATQPFGPVYF